MAVLSYNEISLKKVIIWNGEPHLVLSSHVFRKQQRKPVNITKLKSLMSKKVIEQTFHQNETAEEADIEKREIKYLYENRGEHWFCSPNNPSDRFNLSKEIVGDLGKFVPQNSIVEALLFNDDIFSVQIPIKANLKVIEASEAVKGNTSSGATKEVTLETGHIIQVPQFINAGDVISVNTDTGSYSERIEKA